MERKGLDRLFEAQKQLLMSTQDGLKQNKGFRDDYVKLRKRLETLPDKTSYDVQVPFSRFAFMPGRLVHTNEIMVLLSDVWFVERSSKQAIEIVDRRIADVDQRIDKLYKEQSLIEPRLSYMSELQQIAEGGAGFVEIKEPYDEEKDRICRERRKLQKVTDGAHKTDEALWARLEALENIEEANDELNQIEETSEEDTAPVNSTSDYFELLMSSLSKHSKVVDAQPRIPSTSACLPRDDSGLKRRSVTWKDNEDHLAKEDVDDDEDDDDDDHDDDDDNRDDDDDECEESKEIRDETVARRSSVRSKTINFIHTKVAGFTANSESTGESQETIQSPSDIYRLLMSRPKSILKSNVSTEVKAPSDHVELEGYLASKPSISTSVPFVCPFAEIIMERTVTVDEGIAPRKTHASDIDSSSGSKKFSKFKMARLKGAQK